MKSVSWSRTLQWLAFQWHLKKIKLLYFCLLTGSLLAITYATILTSSHLAWPKISFKDQYVTFVYGLIAFGVLVAYELGKSWIKGPEGIYRNLLPFSLAEQTIGQLLILILGAPILFCLIFYLVTVASLWVSNHLIDYTEYMYYDPDRINVVLPLSPLHPKLQMPLLVYQLIVAMFLFGMLTIRRLPFLMTAISVFLIMSSVPILMSELPGLFLPEGWRAHMLGDWFLQGPRGYFAVVELAPFFKIIPYVLAPLCAVAIYLASYYRSQEAQIC